MLPWPVVDLLLIHINVWQQLEVCYTIYHIFVNSAWVYSLKKTVIKVKINEHECKAIGLGAFVFELKLRIYTRTHMHTPL